MICDLFLKQLEIDMIALIFALASLFTENEKELLVNEDLKSKWAIVDNGRFEKYEGQTVKTIHFSISLKREDQRFLKIQSTTYIYEAE